MRGAIMMDFGPMLSRTITPESACSATLRAIEKVNDAHHDAEPRVQWSAYETTYQQPPIAMADLWRHLGRAFGVIWFSEGYPVRWFHYGGSSRLRVEVAHYCARQLWKMCERYTKKENLKAGIGDNAKAIAFNNAERHRWIDTFAETLPSREIEPWVLAAWRVEKNRERRRHRDPDAFVPRTMSYEQVARWLDDVVESSHSID